MEIPFFQMRPVLVQTWILLACAAVVAGDNPTIKAGGVVSPRWSVRIQDVIKDPIVPTVYGRGREYKRQPEIRLHFVDNSTLAVSIVTLPRNSPKLAVREPSDPSLPMRLQAIFLDAATGKVLATPSWPTPDRKARIIAARDGKVVTLVENKVTLFGSDLKAMKTLTLPMAMAAVVSPSEKTILFTAYKDSSHWSGNPRLTRPEDLESLWYWVSFDDLQIFKSWEEPLTGPISITNDTVAMVACTYTSVCEPHLAVRRVDQGWRNIAPAKWGADPVFLTNELVLVSKVSDLDGSAVFDLPQEDGRIGWGRPCYPPCEVAPRSSGRFIFPGWKTTGYLPSLDIAGHSVLEKLLVYDTRPQLRGFVLDVKDTKIRDFPLFALSPDGSLLAVVNEGVIQVLMLPPAD